MNTPHKATPEQWRQVANWAHFYAESCILELRDTLAALEQRVKALEGPAAEAAELRAALQQENQRRLAQEASAPAAAPAPDGESEYTDAEWSEIQRFTAPAAAPAPAPPMSLVDAVEARAGGDARSAIREVADWLQLRRTGRIANGSQFAELLREEAERG